MVLNLKNEEVNELIREPSVVLWRFFHEHCWFSLRFLK
jgi:hypothetical protein